MNLGENIYKYRSAKNMSQGDLADHLDVSRQSVSKWENNSAVPELEKLIKMAKLFSVTLDELITGEENIQTPSPVSVVPQSRPFPPRTVVGIVLLGIGLLGILLSVICGNILDSVSYNLFSLVMLCLLPLNIGLGCLGAEKPILFYICLILYFLSIAAIWCLSLISHTFGYVFWLVLPFGLSLSVWAWHLWRQIWSLKLN